MQNLAASLDMDALRAKYFPYKSTEGFTIKPVSLEVLRESMKANVQLVFPDIERAESRLYKPSEARLASQARMQELYLRLHHERFLIYDESGKACGWFMGEAEDAMTFYMRNGGVIPDLRNRGLYQEFAARFFSYLAEIGYERISSHHQSTNRAVLIANLKLGFNITGLELTERFGPLVKMVKLLASDRLDSYCQQYGMLDHLDRKTAGVKK